MAETKNPFNLRKYFLGDEKLASIGDRTVIEFRGDHLTYNRLQDAVDSCTRQLHSLGVKEGDRVAMLLYDSPEFVAYFLATVSLKAICVPINTYLTADEIEFILSDSGATVLIIEQVLMEKLKRSESDNEITGFVSKLIIDNYGSSTLSEKLECSSPLRSVTFYSSVGDHDLPSLISASASSFSSNFEKTMNSISGATPAFILYTSGSTGSPKGALHTHGNIAATVNGFGRSVLNLQPDDKVFSASRLFFAYGLGNSLSFPIAAGATVILTNERPTPQAISQIFLEQRPTVFFGVPAVYRGLLDLNRSGIDLHITSLRMCVSAGEALPATIFEEWRNTFGLPILDGIGSTEMLHMFISNREGGEKAGSSGEIVGGYEAEILDEEGNQTALGDQGNLWIKGASAMTGYWNRDDLTANVFRDDWVRTGDIYRCDEAGYYYYIGRSDDCFKVKGLWVSPIEVESVLLCHSDVIEAAVIANNDVNGLATVKAYLVIRQASESLKEELFEFTKARLASYKTPTQIEFISEMPRTSTGKIQRFKLRV